jgi:hypothetical protein
MILVTSGRDQVRPQMDPGQPRRDLPQLDALGLDAIRPDNTHDS